MRWKRLLVVCGAVALVGGAWCLASKPDQPKGYKSYICHEAFRGAQSQCVHEMQNLEMPEYTLLCSRVAARSERFCLDSLPERYAEPD